MQKLSLKVILSFFSYAALPAGLLVLAFVSPTSGVFAKAGSAAQWLLAFLLFLKPAAVISRNARLTRLLQYRRQMGVAVFWLALFHGAGCIVIYDIWRTVPFLDLSSFYAYGAAALIGIILLGLTSNDISVRILKRNWKRLQMLAYPILGLVFLHSSMAQDALWKFFLVAGLFAAAKYGEYEAVRRRKDNG